MTRLGARLDRDLHRIADSATPSSDAWQSIRRRAAADDSDDSNAVIVLDPPSTSSPTNRRWLYAAAAACSALLIGGLFVAGVRSGEDPQPVDTPTSTLPPVPTTNVDSTTTTTPAVDQQAQAPPLPSQSGFELTTGRYRTDDLGVGMTIEAAVPLRVAAVRPNLIELEDPAGPGGRTLSFSRISGWNTPSEGVDVSRTAAGSIDPLDVDVWAADNGLAAEIPACCRSDASPAERLDVTIAGRPATPLEVRLTDGAVQTFACGERRCLYAASLAERGTAARSSTDFLLTTGTIHRLWVIPIDGEDPILIRASTTDGDEDWIDLVLETALVALDTGDS